MKYDLRHLRWICSVLRLVILGVMASSACGSASGARGPARPAPVARADIAQLDGNWRLAFSVKAAQLVVKVDQQYCGEVEHAATDVVVVSRAGTELQVLPWLECADFDEHDAGSGPSHSPRARLAIQARQAKIDAMLAAQGFVAVGVRVPAELAIVTSRDHVHLVRDRKMVADAVRRKDLDQHDREQVVARDAAYIPSLDAVVVVIVPAQTPRSHHEFAPDRFEVMLLFLHGRP